jgi:Spy/CpxP family protein refolding chaperone
MSKRIAKLFEDPDIQEMARNLIRDYGTKYIAQEFAESVEFHVFQEGQIDHENLMHELDIVEAQRDKVKEFLEACEIAESEDFQEHQIKTGGLSYEDS